MDLFKNISEKIFGTADNISRKTDSYIEMGELKFDLKLLEREVEDRKLLLGSYIYEWYSNREIDIREVPRIWREINEREKEMGSIVSKIQRLSGNRNI